jgi:hypothetical protein
VPPALAISTKNKHLLVVYSTPARGFTAAVSVFRGTPSKKPLKCKLSFARCGARPAGLTRAHHVGGRPRPAFARFTFAPGDIIKTSRCSSS